MLKRQSEIRSPLNPTGFWDEPVHCHSHRCCSRQHDHRMSDDIIYYSKGTGNNARFCFFSTHLFPFIYVGSIGFPLHYLAGRFWIIAVENYGRIANSAE